MLQSWLLDSVEPRPSLLVPLSQGCKHNTGRFGKQASLHVLAVGMYVMGCAADTEEGLGEVLGWGQAT